MVENNGLIIPWDKFREEEIQALIEMLFYSLDYTTKNLHKSDRANENGADLVVSKDKETIAIAVKIKPNQKDRYQLVELSRRKEKKKIYVYIQTPTKKFQDTMDTDGKDVDLWDKKKLNEFFVQNNLYFTANVIFENSEIYKNIESLSYLLFNLWKNSKERKKEKFAQLDKKNFALLWRLKDDAVTIHQANKLMISMFQEPMKFNNREFDEYFYRIFLNYLDRLSMKSSLFISYFSEFFNSNKNLVYNSIIENSTRSHWIWLASFKPLNCYEHMKKSLKRAIQERESLEELIKDDDDSNKGELEKHCEEISKSNSVWKAMLKQTESLMIIGMAIEGLIDDIIEEYYDDNQFLINEFELFV